MSSARERQPQAMRQRRETVVSRRAGKEQHDTRYLVGVCARTADGIALVCSHVKVCEYGEADNPFAWEVSCLGIEQPPHKELFPHHVKAYEDRFKE
jgi:hypothetical protein